MTHRSTVGHGVRADLVRVRFVKRLMLARVVATAFVAPAGPVDSSGFVDAGTLVHANRAGPDN